MKITFVSLLSLLAGTTLASPVPKSKTISTTTISSSTSAANPLGSNFLAPGSGGISLCLTFGINCPKKVDSRDAHATDSELVKRPVGPVCPPGSTYNGHRCVGSKVRREPEPHFHPVGPESPPPAPANVVKRDPEPVAEPVFGATPHCSTNKKLCSDVSGKVKREPEPEPQGFPVGPVTAPSSTPPATTPPPATKTTKHRKSSATTKSIAKREAEANPDPFISIKPSPVGPETVSLPPTTTPKTTKTSKASATAKSDRIAKRNPEGAPEPLISILPSPVGPLTAASPTSTSKSTKTHKAAAIATAETLNERNANPEPIKPIVPSPLPSGASSGFHCTANGKICSDSEDAVGKRDAEAKSEPAAFISILPSPVGPHTAALPTSTSKATKSHKASATPATADTLIKRDPNPDPDPIILPGGTKPHCSANGKICSNTEGTVKRDAQPEAEAMVLPNCKETPAHAKCRVAVR